MTEKAVPTPDANNPVRLPFTQKKKKQLTNLFYSVSSHHHVSIHQIRSPKCLKLSKSCHCMNNANEQEFKPLHQPLSTHMVTSPQRFVYFEITIRFSKQTIVRNVRLYSDVANDHHTAAGLKVKNAWSSISTPYTFITW
jgi:hypothetical protein